MTQQKTNLADFIRDRRTELGLSQAQLAEITSLNLSTVNRIETGKTEGVKLRTKVKQSLASALRISETQLNAIAKGQTYQPSNKVCFQCWTPATAPDIRWSDDDANFCLCCGSELYQGCMHCGHPIYVEGRFCPSCGKSYQS